MIFLANDDPWLSMAHVGFEVTLNCLDPIWYWRSFTALGTMACSFLVEITCALKDWALHLRGKFCFKTLCLSPPNSRKMAPKVRGKADDSKGPSLTNDKRIVRLEDLSIDESSGHRALDPARVTSLLETFMSGKYGRNKNLLRGPGVIDKALDKEGLQILEDGKHTIAALKKCQEAGRFVQVSFLIFGVFKLSWASPPWKSDPLQLTFARVFPIKSRGRSTKSSCRLRRPL